MLKQIGNRVYSEQAYREAVDPITSDIKEIQSTGENECILCVYAGDEIKKIKINKSSKQVVDAINIYHEVITQVFNQIDK